MHVCVCVCVCVHVRACVWVCYYVCVPAHHNDIVRIGIQLGSNRMLFRAYSLAHWLNHGSSVVVQ